MKFCDQGGMNDLARLPQMIAAQDWAGAAHLLRRVAAHPGAPAQVHYNLAKVLEAQGEGAQMLPWLHRAVQRDPSYALAWFEIGRAEIAAGDLSAAAVAFARAWALDPRDDDAVRNLMRVALRLGDWAQARQAARALPQSDAEALAARYRCACELGEAAEDLRARLLADPQIRPVALKALTRVAKGSLPLRLG
ncbi:MAG: tetratricopeptide repeat protein [Paracoccaceae bacterium]|nr:tetratricopeptide repeat protein [Paracoccaceae bacterium]